MSCITELLRLKGNKEYLHHPNNTEWDGIIIEDGGLYKGNEFFISFSSRGIRCGYVAISEEIIKKYNINENNIDVRVHGGVTFFENHHPLKNMLSHPCTDFWIGFDANHYRDGMDCDLLKKIFPKSRLLELKYEFLSSEDEIRDLNYMIEECKRLIDQLIKKKWLTEG